MAPIRQSQARSAKTAVDWARKEGLRPGLELLKTSALATPAPPPQIAGQATLSRATPAKDCRARREIQLGVLQSQRVRLMPRPEHDGLGGGPRPAPKDFRLTRKPPPNGSKCWKWFIRPNPCWSAWTPPEPWSSWLTPLVGLAANNHPADRLTDTFVANIAAQQRADGSWHVGAAARPPAEEGDIFRTAVCISGH